MRQHVVLKLNVWLRGARTAAAIGAAAAEDVVVERDVRAKMRDGVRLKAEIYRPKAEGKNPVLLPRIPYNKSARCVALGGARQGQDHSGG